MKTLGIDLSSDSKKTAACMVTWSKGKAVVGQPKLGATDEDLVPLLVEADWSGIDAPFGWPDAMVLAIHRYATEGEWGDINKSEFRHRLTDRFAAEQIRARTGKGLSPMSVSADKIAMLAWRVAQLREAYADRTSQRFDRSGRDRVVEVYPAAALLLWGLDKTGYKTSRNREKLESEKKVRESLIISIEVQAPWLAWEKEARAACIENDDSLDALLAAFNARAAAVGLTTLPGPENEEQASSEGWIHLPDDGSLAELLMTSQ